MYFKWTQGIALCYSCVERESFDGLENWLKQIDEKAPKDVQKVLIANKSDLDQEIEVPHDEGKARA